MPRLRAQRRADCRGADSLVVVDAEKQAPREMAPGAVTAGDWLAPFGRPRAVKKEMVRRRGDFKGARRVKGEKHLSPAIIPPG